MPNFTILPQGLAEESDEAPKKFTNIDTEPFSFHWDGKPFGGMFPERMSVEEIDETNPDGTVMKRKVYEVTKPFEPGETVTMPKYLVNFAAMHLARKIWKRTAVSNFQGTEYEKKNAAIKIVNPEEEVRLMNKMVAANFPDNNGTTKEPPIPEVSKENVIDKTLVEEPPKEEKKKFKCEVCGFEAKNANGLRLHSRKHK